MDVVVGLVDQYAMVEVNFKKKSWRWSVTERWAGPDSTGHRGLAELPAARATPAWISGVPGAAVESVPAGRALPVWTSSPPSGSP